MHATADSIRHHTRAAIRLVALLAGLAAPAGALGEPETTITAPAVGAVLAAGIPIELRGTASDDVAVGSVKVSITEVATQLWLRRDGTWGASDSHVVPLAPPGGRSVTWSFRFTAPRPGQYSVRATARDDRGVKDDSSARRTLTVGGAAATPTRPPATATRTRPPATATRTRPPATSTLAPATATRPPTALPTATRVATMAPTASYTPTSVPPTATLVPGAPPVADFAIDAASGPAPHVVQFTDASSGGASAWLWEFGDGTTSSRQHPIHTFLAPGTYTVRLTVSGPSGSAAIVRDAAIMVGPTAAGGGGGATEFVAYCPFSHRLRDDPIVFPGMEGMSHVHAFFGSTVANAHSTVDDLLAGGTTCDPLADRSAYWLPTLYNDGVAVDPEQATFYYFAGVTQRTAIRPFPIGLRILAGNPRRTGPTDGPSVYKWSCRGAAVSSTADFVVCPDGHELELLLNFPDCWNGSDLDSANHQSHMAYSAGGTCPASHPVPLPRLQFKLRYPFSGGPHVSIAAGSGDMAHEHGAGWTIHADFINAWEPAAQQARVVNCLHRGVKCQPNGLP